MQKNKLIISIFSLLVFFINTISAQQRPFIWVTKQDKKEIMGRIQNKAWAKSSYESFISSLENNIAAHQKNPDKFLRDIPFDWENQNPGETPPFFYTTHIVNGKHLNLDNATAEAYTNGKKHNVFLEKAIDCGVAYYTTEDEKYAQCATSIAILLGKKVQVF